jgi:hypothetical protein
MSKAAAIRWSNAPHELGVRFENDGVCCVQHALMKSAEAAAVRHF